MKSGVQPWMGWAAKAGCEAFGEPSALRSVATPEANRPAASGSANTIFTSGIDALRAFPAPWNVPPVPYPVTQCVSFLPLALKSAMISGPVVASWNFQL